MRWRNWSWWTPSTSRGTGRRNSQRKPPEMDSLSWTRRDFMLFFKIFLTVMKYEDLWHLSINLLMLDRLKLNQWRWCDRSQSFLWPSSQRWTVRFWSCRMLGRISVCWSSFLTRFKMKPLAFRRWDRWVYSIWCIFSLFGIAGCCININRWRVTVCKTYFFLWN